jgi:ADP-ribose pyrophosphatase
MQINRPISKQPMPEGARRMYKGRIFEVYEWDQELYNGKKITFEKVKRPDTVSIFAVLSDGKILLIEEEQPGTEVYVGPMGGRVDEGEEPLEAAKRELLEESGYVANELNLWLSEHPVNKMDWVIYTFIAKGLKKVSEPELDGGEKIKFSPITLDELIEKATSDPDSFSEKEVLLKFYQAKLNPKKMQELKELFKPLE